MFAAAAQRVRVVEGFQVRRAPALSLLGAAVLGVALWPLASELFLLGKLSGLATLDRDQFAEVERLLHAFETLSPVLVLGTLSLVQPVCEELFFRGYLLNGLRERFPGAGAVVASSLLFGLFHVLNPATLTPERFLPSTFLGLFLGWLCYRTGSVLPGMIAHALHNGLLLLIAQYRDWIIARGWDVEGHEHMPVLWLVSAAVVTLVGMGLVNLATRRRPRAAT